MKMTLRREEKVVRGNHGLAGGAREFPTRPVSQFVEEEKEGRKPRWNELEGKLSAGGGEGEGLYRTWERNCYPLRFSLRSVRGVKGIRSLSRRANSRLAELWGSHSRRDGRRARPRKFSTTFAK